MNTLAIIPGFGQGVKGGQLLNRGRKLLNGTGKNTKKVVSSGKKVSTSGASAKHYTDFADEAAEIMERSARSRGLDPNRAIWNMARKLDIK